MNKIHGLLPILFLFSCDALANTLIDTQSWLNVTAIGNFYKTNKSPSRYKYWLEGQERVGDDISESTQSLLRSGIGYSLTENWSLWAGYAWVRTGYPLANTPFEENRIWEQLLWMKSYTNFTLTSRTRMEQRFLETSHKTAYRARQLFKVAIPLKSYSKLSVVSSDEVFIHKNNFIGTASKGFDQNRFFIGLGYRFNSKINTEIGYMNQYIRRVGIPNFQANIAAINCYLSL